MERTGVSGKPGEAHGPAHGLQHAIEAHAVLIGALAAKGRGHHQDDVGLELHQRGIVEPQFLQHLERQIGHHDVGAFYQALDDGPGLGPAEIERHAPLVAIDVEKQPAFAAVDDRPDPAVLAAVAPLDANHLGPKIGQHHRGIRTRNETAEVENANTFEQRRHGGQPSTGRSANQDQVSQLEVRSSASQAAASFGGADPGIESR